MSARQEMQNALMRERVVEHIEVLAAAVAAAETAGEDLIVFFEARLNEEWMGHDPARALREVEAGRKLLDEYKRYRASAASQTEVYGQVGPGTWAVVRVLYRAIAFAASVHADHPDYRQEWRL